MDGLEAADGERLLERGLTADAAGDVARAEESFRSAKSWFSDQQDSDGVLRSSINLAATLYLGTRLQEAERELEGALTLAQSLENRGAEARCLGNLALIRRDLGHPEAEIGLLEAALAAARKAGDARAIAGALGNLGLAHRARGDLDRAMAHLVMSLSQFQRAHDGRGAATSLCCMADLFTSRGDLDSAGKALEDAVRIFREDGDLRGEAQALEGLGNLHRVQSRMDLAKETYDRAMRIHRFIGDRRGLAVAHLNLSAIAVHEGDPARARKELNDALAHSKASSFRAGEAQVLQTMAAQAFRRGDLVSAEGIYKEARAAFQSLIHAESEAASRLGLVSVLLRADRISDAKDALTVVKDQENAQGNPAISAEIRLIESQLALVAGDLDSAEKVAQEAHDRFESLKRSAAATRVMGILGETARQKDLLDLARERVATVRRFFKEIGDEPGEASARLHEALLDVDRGQFDSAKATALSVLPIFLRAEEYLLASRCEYLLAEVLEKSEAFAEALMILDRALDREQVRAVPTDRSEMLAFKGLLLARMGRPKEGADLARIALGTLRENASVFPLVRGLRRTLEVESYFGPSELFFALRAEAQALVDRHGLALEARYLRSVR